VRRALVLFAGAAALLSVAGTSLAHGDLESTTPEDGSTVRKVPQRISISLTEPPTAGAEARARDGCKRRAPGATSIDGNDIVVAVAGGEPGKWRVSYRAVSAVDGHQTRGNFSFKVSGRRDCSPDEKESEDDVDAADAPGIVENPNPPDEGTSWLVWVGAGTVLIAAAAFVLRRAGR